MSNEKAKNSSFLTEALIISASHFAVKIIGILYKVPLGNLLDDSMSAFTAAYSIYAMMFALSTSGLPVAISRMIAASNEKGRMAETKKIFKISFIALCAVGLLGSLAMFFLAEPMAVWSDHPNATQAIKVIAPTLFFVCITSSLRGYFQGLRNMYPTAISQFLEAVVKLVLGLGGAVYAKSIGLPGYLQAAYAAIGITAGVFFGTVSLIFYKKYSHRSVLKYTTDECDSVPVLCKNIFLIALPVTITSGALYMNQFVDTIAINTCLKRAGYALEVADRMFAAYSALALSISDLLPSMFVYPIAISILPAVSAAHAVNRVKDVRKYIVQSIRISGIISLPCSLCLAVLTKPCISLIYGERWGMSVNGSITMLDGTSVTPVDLASAGLSILAVGVFLVSMLSVTNSLLQALGKVYYPTISTSLGVVFLVVTEYLLVSNPSIGIYGAPVASLVCYAVSSSLNTFKLKRLDRSLDLNLVRLFGKPFICSALSAAICIAVYNVGLLITGGSFSRITSLVYILVSALFAIPAYVVSIIAMKGITVDEIELLPKGNVLAEFLVKKGYLEREAED